MSGEHSQQVKIRAWSFSHHEIHTVPVGAESVAALPWPGVTADWRPVMVAPLAIT
ncbi:MAG: hypothetical protein RQ826_09115 [Xanthomonadales bacterium]|nr:hypothetical protein [Xanthomonadales bacterium]